MLNQFCSSDWEEINSDTQKNEDSFQTSIDECLGARQNFEEDDSNSRESLSMAEYAYYYNFYWKYSDLTFNSNNPRESRTFNK